MLAQDAPAAELWQLRWHTAAALATNIAAQVARCLHINPGFASAPAPPALLAAPLAVSLDIEHVSASLLTPAIGPDHSTVPAAQELASLRLEHLQVPEGSCSLTGMQRQN